MFGLKRLPPIDAAAPPPIDALVCVPQTAHDDFTGSMTCDDWGSPTGGAAVEGNGTLRVSPSPSSSQGGCISRAPVAFAGSGLFLKIPQLLDPDHESTGSGGTFVFFRTVEVTAGDGEVLTISANDNQINVAETSTHTTLVNTPYDPVAMLWWRIRPAVGAVVAEVSPDGLSWQLLATTPGTVPTAVLVEFTAGEYSAGIADPGTALFEDFNICP